MDKWFITVTVSREGGQDKWGDPLDPVEHTEDGALFDPGSSLNDVDRDDSPDESAKLFFPDRFNVDIRNTDFVRFEWLGEPYGLTVSGRPLKYPLGTQVNLRG